MTRRWFMGLGLMGVFLVVGCAGPGQPPKTMDLVFPLPYLLKGNSPAQQSQATHESGGVKR